MRRLLPVALLCAGVAVPAHAQAPAVADTGWRVRQYAAVAHESAAPALAARLAAAAAAGESRVLSAFAGPDLDRDGVAEYVTYETVWSGDTNPTGTTTVTAYAGRTGKRLWATTLPVPFAAPVNGKVGAKGVTGLLLVAVTQPAPGTGDIRVRALDGTHVVYDRTVTSTDGHGEVDWGGTFDGVHGGGTDVLFSRVLSAGGEPTPAGVTAPAASLVRAQILDGANGAVADVGTPDAGAGQGAVYAAGDLDKDGRDDLVLVRPGATPSHGTVTAISSASGAPIWTNATAPIGRTEGALLSTDLVGDARHDVVLAEWIDGSGAVPVTAPAPLDSPKRGTHVVVIDGATGTLAWDRLDSATYLSFDVHAVGHGYGRRLVLVGVAPVAGGLALRTLGLSGANQVLYRRDLPAVGNSTDTAYVFVGGAGDVDADGMDDAEVFFLVVRGSDLVDGLSGVLHARDGRIVQTDRGLLGASLDGHGADLYLPSFGTDGLRFSTEDGRNGRAYWSVHVVGRHVGGFPFALSGAHGCAAYVAVLAGDSSHLWAGALDPRTGRLRWGRTVEGGAWSPAVVSAGGAPGCH